MTDDGLSELADRVRALEQRLDAATAVDRAVDDQSRPVFWALDELSARGADAVLYAGTVTPPGQEPVRWQLTRSSADLLAADWSTHAAALSALGHPVRLRILQLVATGAATTAAELAGAEGLGSTGQIYHHLRQLVSTGWLRATTRGQHAVPPDRLVPLLAVLSAAS